MVICIQIYSPLLLSLSNISIMTKSHVLLYTDYWSIVDAIPSIRRILLILPPLALLSQVNSLLCSYNYRVSTKIVPARFINLTSLPSSWTCIVHEPSGCTTTEHVSVLLPGVEVSENCEIQSLHSWNCPTHGNIGTHVHNILSQDRGVGGDKLGWVKCLVWTGSKSLL